MEISGQSYAKNYLVKFCRSKEGKSLDRSEKKTLTALGGYVAFDHQSGPWWI